MHNMYYTIINLPGMPPQAEVTSRTGREENFPARK
jgi:hypothetical protein